MEQMILMLVKDKIKIEVVNGESLKRKNQKRKKDNNLRIRNKRIRKS